MTQAVVWTGLFHGAVLCALMTGIIVGSLVQDPHIWGHSAPPDVRKVLGPAGPQTLRRKRLWGVVMMAVLLGVFWHLVAEVLRLGEGAGGLAHVAVASWLAFQVFNLYDAAIIDVGLVVFKPRWAFVPGTENLPGLKDVRWHLANYFKGFVGGFVFAGLVTGVTWVVLTVA